MQPPPVPADERQTHQVARELAAGGGQSTCTNPIKPTSPTQPSPSVSSWLRTEFEVCFDPATSDELFEPGEDADEGMDPSLIVGSEPTLPSPSGTAMDELGVVEVEEGTDDSGNVPTREDDEDGDCVSG